MPNRMSGKNIPLCDTPTPAKDARSVALRVLLSVVQGNADTQDVLDRELKKASLSVADRKLCTELVYGTLRQKIRLDCFLQRFLQHPDRLPAELVSGLEIALYEFFFLRVPVHASFDQAVAAAKRQFGPRMGGLVNAVLRNAQRKADDFFKEETYRKTGSDAEELSADGERWDAFTRVCSMPLWIGRMWRQSYGEDKARVFLHAAAQSAPAGVRVKPGSFGLSPDESARLVFACNASAFAFDGSLPERLESAVKEGRAARQSTASYEALWALGPEKWPLPVWDCCAGRGGKTLALLEANIPVALASDVSKRRLHGFLDDARHLGCPSELSVMAGSAIDVAAWLADKGSVGEGATAHTPTLLAGDAGQIPERFGSVLVDAPCTGLGTLSRHPEIRFRRSIKDIEGLAASQYKILRAAAGRVRSGGYLVYLTCTLTREENEEQVAAFLKDHPGAEIVRSFSTPGDSPLREFFFGVCIRLS